MKKYKIILFVLFTIAGLNKSIGQDPFDSIMKNLKREYPMPMLSKTEMYADFDTLVSIMKRCNAQYLVRKKVTGYDMVLEMKKLRNNITHIHSTVEFVNLLERVLSLSLDQHCINGLNVFWFKDDYYEQDYKTNNLTDKEFGINLNYMDSILYNSPISLFYTEGKYFLQNNTTYYNGNDSVIIPLGTEVVSFNNYPIVAYQNAIRNRHCRWNFDKKFFYNTKLYCTGEKNSIEFRINNKNIAYSFTNYIQKEKQWIPIKKFCCNWFAKDSVLYFRIPQMSYSSEQMVQFQQEVLKYQSQPIKSVIIDTRGNEGGDDNIWIELLGIIIKDPIKYPFCLISNDEKDVLTRFTPKIRKNVTFKFINPKHKFVIFEQETDTIKPKIENLGYKKEIFILLDEDIYSSTMGLASLCTKTDRIKTIGIPTGKFGGQGVEAKAFILPHSRFVFVLDILLDGSCITKPEDFYHDKVTYPITPSIEYYKYWYNPMRPDSIDEKTMYKHDEVFIKALEVIKEFR